MPIGQISDLLSVYLWIPIIFQFHRSPPENTPWSFYRHIIADSRPSAGLFEYGPLRNRLEALWGFGKRALLEPNRVLVSRGLGERLGPLFRGLHCSSLLGLGTRPYHLSLKPGDISHDVFGLYLTQRNSPLRLSFSNPVYRAIGTMPPRGFFQSSAIIELVDTHLFELLP